MNGPHVDSFRQARNYRKGRIRPLRLIVLHSTEGGETSHSAEDVAVMFATTDRKASAHVCIDTNTVVGCVHPIDTAFAAAGANSDGYHIEQSGRAGQSPEQWNDAASRAIVERTARHVAEASAAFGIPLVRLTVAQVADGHTKGLTDHATVSQAFPNVSTGHWDPGPNYPWQRLLTLAQTHNGGPFMALTDDEQRELLDRVRGMHEANWVDAKGRGNLTWLVDKVTKPILAKLDQIIAKL